MFFPKRFTRFLSTFLFILIIAIGCGTTTAYAAEDYGLYAGGFPAGFVLNTKTVEVIGVCDVMTDEGAVSPARRSGIKSGDVIESINEITISSIEEFGTVLQQNFSKFNLKVKREGQTLEINITPVTDKTTGKKRLGLLVKDTINGIGTVTYIDKRNNSYASLGHPVSDAENNIVNINGGSIYGCVIYDVKKGQRGTPGELKGVFENSNMIGSAEKNCACGIYGKISSEFSTENLVKVNKGCVADAKIGKAEIYTTVKGDKPNKYEISIVKVDANNKDNRNYVIKVEDKELLEISGGIVQGMSGSPIIQDGKLIGAVTHVFVNDPTRGYGISVDNMFNS